MEASHQRLRILHLSDLHARGARENESWRRRRVLGAAWRRNLDALLKDGPFDLVCFTGDIAFSGSPGEYAEATTFVQGLLKTLNLPSNRFFAVPGNHDIQRNVGKIAWHGFTSLLHKLDPIDISRWLLGGPPPPGAAPAWRHALLKRSKNFQDWLGSIGRSDLHPERSTHGSLGFHARVDLPDLSVPVHVVGLNSAWLCGRDREAGTLWLTDDQAMRLTTTADGSPLDGLRIGLCHHPLHELADGPHCQRLLATSVDILLRGHLHETELAVWADPDHRLLNLAAGALYEQRRADQHPNAIHSLTLWMTPSGRPVTAEVRVRTWSSRSGDWFDDNSLFKGMSAGTIRAEWIRAHELTTANPYSPWTPTAPTNFVGRGAVLRRLEVAAAEQRSVSLAGDTRIGKTSLLRAWANRAANQGRMVTQLSGEGREAESIASFVATVTSLPPEDDPDRAAELLILWAGMVTKKSLGPPILVIDEFEPMISRFPNRFFERLRGMLGTIALVVASRQELDYVFQDLGRSSPFHNRLELQWLGLLSTAEGISIVDRSSPLLTPKERTEFHRYAGNHPFYLQLLGWHLVNQRLAGVSLVEGYAAFTIEAASRLRELWRTLPLRDREAVRHACFQGPIEGRRLRARGVLRDDGRPFGEVLRDWVAENGE